MLHGFSLHGVYLIQPDCDVLYIHLHNQHVISLHALSGEVTHVTNQPCLSTPCLSHNDHWNTTPVYVIVDMCREREELQSVSGIQVDKQTYRWKYQQAYNRPESHLNGQNLDEVVYS